MTEIKYGGQIYKFTLNFTLLEFYFSEKEFLNLSPVTHGCKFIKELGIMYSTMYFFCTPPKLCISFVNEHGL